VRRSAMQMLIESNLTHKERSKLLSCYIYVNVNKSKMYNDAMYDQCVRMFDPSMCQHHCVNITTMLPDVTSEYITSLRQSKLIILFSSLHDNCHSNDWTKMTSAWIAEAVMAGAIPVVNMSCFLSSNIDLRGFSMKLPIIDINAYQQSKTTTITTTTHDPQTQLLSMYSDIMTHSDLYSRAPFYLSFWLHQLLPIIEALLNIMNSSIHIYPDYVTTCSIIPTSCYHHLML
jgi:hypothetical protein